MSSTTRSGTENPSALQSPSLAPATTNYPASLVSTPSSTLSSFSVPSIALETSGLRPSPTSITLAQPDNTVVHGITINTGNCANLGTPKIIDDYGRSVPLTSLGNGTFSASWQSGSEDRFSGFVFLSDDGSRCGANGECVGAYITYDPASGTSLSVSRAGGRDRPMYPLSIWLADGITWDGQLANDPERMYHCRGWSQEECPNSYMHTNDRQYTLTSRSYTSHLFITFCLADGPALLNNPSNPDREEATPSRKAILVPRALPKSIVLKGVPSHLTVSTSTEVLSSTSARPTSTSAPDDSNDRNNRRTIIAGAVAGSLIGLALSGLFVWYMFSRRNKKWTRDYLTRPNPIQLGPGGGGSRVSHSLWDLDGGPPLEASYAEPWVPLAPASRTQLSTGTKVTANRPEIGSAAGSMGPSRGPDPLSDGSGSSWNPSPSDHHTIPSPTGTRGGKSVLRVQPTRQPDSVSWGPAQPSQYASTPTYPSPPLSPPLSTESVQPPYLSSHMNQPLPLRLPPQHQDDDERLRHDDVPPQYNEAWNPMRAASGL